jgi:hypothetical protein
VGQLQADADPTLQMNETKPGVAVKRLIIKEARQTPGLGADFHFYRRQDLSPGVAYRLAPAVRHNTGSKGGARTPGTKLATAPVECCGSPIECRLCAEQLSRRPMAPGKQCQGQRRSKACEPQQRVWHAERMRDVEYWGHWLRVVWHAILNPVELGRIHRRHLHCGHLDIALIVVKLTMQRIGKSIDRVLAGAVRRLKRNGTVGLTFRGLIYPICASITCASVNKMLSLGFEKRSMRKIIYYGWASRSQAVGDIIRKIVYGAFLARCQYEA